MPAAQHIGCVRTASTSKSAPYMARRRIKVKVLIFKFISARVKRDLILSYAHVDFRVNMVQKDDHQTPNMAQDADDMLQDNRQSPPTPTPPPPPLTPLPPTPPRFRNRPECTDVLMLRERILLCVSYPLPRDRIRTPCPIS